MNVQIVQPLIPEYRVPFFQQLIQNHEHQVRVFASRNLPNDRSIKTADCIDSAFKVDHPCTGFMNNTLLWQRGILLEDRLTRGDVLVVCGNARFLSNYPLIWQAKRRNIGTVWWGIGSMPGQNRLRYILRTGIMRWMDVVLLYTEREKEEFLRMGFPAKRLFAINNAIDQGSVRAATANWSPSRLAAFKQEHGLIDKQVFLFCGRLSSKARVDLAIEALALLRSHNKDCLLVIIGDGDQRRNLEALAESLKVTHSIRWLGAIFDQNIMAPWFLSAKVFVYPGYIGLSIMHAMGYALPVITHQNMANQSPEVAALIDGQNGILCEENNSSDLCSKILRLISDDDLRLAMSKRALFTASEEFTLSEMVRRFWEAAHAASSIKRRFDA